MELQEVTWISRSAQRAPFHGVKQYIVEDITRGYYQHVVVVDVSFNTDQVLSLPAEDITPARFDMPEIYNPEDFSIVRDNMSILLELKIGVNRSNIVWKTGTRKYEIIDRSTPINVTTLEAMDVRNGLTIYVSSDELKFLTDAADIDMLLAYTPLAIDDMPMVLADYKTFRKLGDTWWVSTTHENYDDIMDGMTYTREQGAQFIPRESQLVSDDYKWSFIDFMNTWKVKYIEIPSGYVVYPHDDTPTAAAPDLGMPVLMWLTTAYERFTRSLPPVFMRYTSMDDRATRLSEYPKWYSDKAEYKVTALTSVRESTDTGVARPLNYALMDSGPDYVWFSAYTPGHLAELDALQSESPPERVDQTA